MDQLNVLKIIQELTYYKPDHQWPITTETIASHRNYNKEDVAQIVQQLKTRGLIEANTEGIILTEKGITAITSL